MLKNIAFMTIAIAGLAINAASAATLSFDGSPIIIDTGANIPTLPVKFGDLKDRNGFLSAAQLASPLVGPLSSNSLVLHKFNSGNDTNAGLRLNGPSSVKFTYIGYEAGNFNTAVDFGPSGGAMFNNHGQNASIFGDMVTVAFAGNFLLPFMFETNGAVAGSAGTATNHGEIMGSMSLTFSQIFNNGRSVIAFFGDGAGDSDYDDLVMRIDVVPVPAALPLFGTGLAALGFMGWRRKRQKTAA